MNRLYTGLMAIVVGTGGCDRTYTEVPAPSPSQNYCVDEHAKIVSLEQKLREQTTKAQADLAKAKTDAQISCDARVDARVKEVEARYAVKGSAELPQEVTAQFPKSDLPMHEIVRGLAAGKYNDAATDFSDTSQEFPFLYRGFVGEGWYDVTLKEQCLQEKGKKAVDLPAEHTACELGAGVAYNFERGEFEVSSWKEYTIEDKEQKGSYYPVKELITFRGLGQGLEWSEVTEVDIRTPATEYGLITMKVSDIEPELVNMYKKSLAEIPPKVLKHAKAELKRIHTPAM